jgi:hypothetical protein
MSDLPPLTEADIPWKGDGKPPKPPRRPQRPTLAEVEAKFERWMHNVDPVPLRVVLATYVANRFLDGDPVWTMLVGGSGRGKTELLITLAGMPDVVLASSITGPGALLSGTGKKDVAKDATGGLLRKLPKGDGTLLLKDFTSIIDMHREARAEVLAALREIYDGRWDRSIGTDGGRTLTFQGHVGIVAGCTTAIDSAYTVIATMGTRFVLVRLPVDDDLGATVLQHVGQETQMRQELQAAVHDLLTAPPGRPNDLANRKAALAALGSFVALARSPVDRDQQGEIRLVMDPEAPTRIVKMLAQLWRAAGILGLSANDAWEMVLRVGLDSIPKLRLMILDVLYTRQGLASTTVIAEAVEHPSRTTRRALEDLTAHRVVRRIAGGEGRADLWELTAQARKWLGATLPGSSDDLQTRLVRTKNIKTDKTGKVPGYETGPKSEGAHEPGDF